MKKLILILCLLLLPVCAYADRAYMILPVQGGSPALGELKCSGHVLLEMYKTTGLYQVTGTSEEITALATLKGAVLITMVTEAKDGEKQWPELDLTVVLKDAETLTTASLAEVTAKPVITDKETYREAIKKLITNKNFETLYWVKDK